MSQSQTSGYDILVQLSEQELNQQLQTSFVLSPIVISSITITPVFNHLELDASANTVGIANCVRLFIDLSGNFSGLPGTAEVCAPIEVWVPSSNPNQRQLVVSFPSNIYVNFIDSNSNANSFIANALKTFLIGRVREPLGPALDMPPSSDPLTPTGLSVKVIDDPNPLGTDCVTMMINTGGSSGGSSAGITKFVGSSPNGAVVVLSNKLVLERLICPKLESSLGATFNAPCTLAQRVQLDDPGNLKIFLETLSVTVEGDHLRVKGTLGGKGKGWKLDGKFSLRLYLELNSGTIGVRQETDQMDADFDFKWWVWVLSGLTGGVLGLLLVALVENFIDDLIDNVISKFAAFTGKLSGIGVPSIPLGPSGGTIEIQSVLLDDLMLQGPVKRVPASAVGLSLRGDLSCVRRESTILLNGNAVSFMQLMTAQAGLPYTITRRLAYRGIFGAVASQPVMPATFQWKLGGQAISMTGVKTLTLNGPSGPATIYCQADGSHCWIWTAAGTEIDFDLSVTLTDGAGHISQATKNLKQPGVVIEKGTTRRLMRDEVGPRVPVFEPESGSNPVIGTLTGIDLSDVDRRVELERAVASARSTTVAEKASAARGKQADIKPRGGKK